MPVSLQNVPSVNIQAFVALCFLAVSLFLGHMIAKIQRGEWPGTAAWVTYLRVVLGFTFAAAIGLGIYSLAGIDILFNR